MKQHPQLTAFLDQWHQGDPDALAKLIDQIYGELKAAAIHYLQGERNDHTLQPTALIHEVYLRLQSGNQLQFENRAQFFGFAGRLMRQILVEHARRRGAHKRGGQVHKMQLSDIDGLGQDNDQNSILAVDEALKKLEKLDKRQAQLIELRFFAGLNITEAAEVMEVSEATVRREWRTARLWFMRQLSLHPPQA